MKDYKIAKALSIQRGVKWEPMPEEPLGKSAVKLTHAERGALSPLGGQAASGALKKDKAKAGG